jgi:hypothetical protein
MDLELKLKLCDIATQFQNAMTELYDLMRDHQELCVALDDRKIELAECRINRLTDRLLDAAS